MKSDNGFSFGEQLFFNSLNNELRKLGYRRRKKESNVWWFSHKEDLRRLKLEYYPSSTTPITGRFGLLINGIHSKTQADEVIKVYDQMICLYR